MLTVNWRICAVLLAEIRVIVVMDAEMRLTACPNHIDTVMEPQRPRKTVCEGPHDSLAQ